MRIFLIVTVSLFLVASGNLFANETIDESSPTFDAMNYEGKTSFSTTADTVLLDGAVKVSPPGLITYDRTFANILRFTSNVSITPLVGTRVIVDSRYNIRKQYEAEEPRRMTQSEWFVGYPTVDMIFKPMPDLEVFAGIKGYYLPESIQTTESLTFTSKNKYGPAFLLIPRAGVIKHTPAASGGLFYALGREKERSLVKTASDGSRVETEETVYSPKQYGVFFRFKPWNYPTDTEVVLVKAGTTGPVSQAGEKVLEDYFRYRLGIFVPWERDKLNFQFVVIHKTLSYSKNAYVSLDSIPMTTAHFKIIQGSVDKHVYLGLIYGQGDDTQSLPEFNAKYKLRAYGAKLGFNYKF